MDSDPREHQGETRNPSESESDKFRQFTDSVFETIVVIENNTIVDVNNEVREMFGYRPKEIVGRPPMTLAAQKARAYAMARIMEEYEGAYESIGLRKDGSEFEMEVRARYGMYEGRRCRITALRDISHHKRLERALVQARDELEQKVLERTRALTEANDLLRQEIAERESAERALLDSETAREAIYSALPDMILLFSSDGIFIDCRASTEVPFYLPPEEFLGKNIVDIMPPHVSKGWLEAAKRLEETREIQSMKYELPIGDTVLHYEARLVARGPERILTIIRDMTEQRDYERGLKESEERFRRFAEATFEGIALVSGGKIQDCNATFGELFGLEIGKIIGREKLEFIAPDSREEVAKRITRQEQSAYETVGLRSDGRTFPIEIRARELKWRGMPARLIVVRDLTERKKAIEALERRDRILRGVCNCAREFLKTRDWRESLPKVLEIMGNALETSRCYIFEESTIEEETKLNFTYEWVSEGIEAAINDPQSQQFSPDDPGIDVMYPELIKKQNVQLHTTEVAEPLRSVLESQCVKSILLTPIFVEDEFFGLIGFDECQEERRWSDVELEALGAAAATLGAAILRTRSEEALQRSRESMRRLLESTRVVPWEAEGYPIHLTYIGPGCEEMLGWTKEELLQPDALKNVVHPDDFEWVRNQLYQNIRERKDSEIECRLLRKDGKTVWIRDIVHLKKDETEVRGLQGFIIDITERKEAEMENERLAVFPRENPALIMEVDEAGNVLYFNPAAQRTLEASAFDNPGQLLPQRHKELVHSALQDGRIRTDIEVDTASRIIRWNYHPMLSMRRVHLYGLDLTEQRMVEEKLRQSADLLLQSQKLEVMGRLTGGVAHDFGNLLTVIKGNADMLLSRVSSNHPSRDKLQQIAQASDQASVLTSQLLAFTRRQVWRPRVMDLNHVLSGFSSMVQRLIGEHISLTLELAEQKLRIYADPVQVRQIVLNLVVNARDAMSQGGSLTMRSSLVENGDESFVSFEVKDTGTGIDDDALPRIFEPFFTTKEGKGTGFGLSMTREIMERTGGTIEVESTPGEGTLFRLLWPEAGGRGYDSQDSTLEDAPRGTETILVVDDEDDLRQMICNVLRDAGYKVIDAANGAEAIEKGEATGKVHAALVDVVMPEINGRSLSEILKRREPDIKIMLMSGFTDDIIGQVAQERPGIPFLEKPFEMRYLLEQIRKLLDGELTSSQ